MNGKIQKGEAEIEKVKAKISTQQARLRELEQQKTELENTEIVGMVRGLDAVSYTHLKCPNGIVLGTPGSGKSFFAKREITNSFFATPDHILILDVENEYTALVEQLHGCLLYTSYGWRWCDSAGPESRSPAVRLIQLRRG